jgi:hypothetical protein
MPTMNTAEKLLMKAIHGYRDKGEWGWQLPWLCWTVLASLLSFCGCGGNKILELKDVQNFHVVESPDKSALEVSGLAFHSALAVEGMTTERRGDDLTVELRLVLARKGLSGSFSYAVGVPVGVNRVLFGRDRKEIWRRS